MMDSVAAVNRLWADTIIEELCRLGVSYACIGPGSRSTPLTLAVARHSEMQTMVHIDERGLGFHALGYAKASGKAVLIITTSGTAVANLLPAVIEASESGVPLIVMTADRPPELIGVGANQAIVQTDLFKQYVRSDVQLPCPNLESSLTTVLESIDRLFYQATIENAGPVHLNCPFREPLFSDEEVSFLDNDIAVMNWKNSLAPYCAAPKKLMTSKDRSLLLKNLQQFSEGVLVVGELANQDEAEAVRLLATTLNWPVFPDVLSQLRFHKDLPFVPYYDALLKNKSITFRPECILQIGSKLISQRLLTVIKESSCKSYIQVLDHPRNQDCLGSVTHRYTLDISEDIRWLAQNLKVNDISSYTRLLCQKSDCIEACSRTLYEDEALTHEVAMTYHSLSMVPDNHVLFLSNSLPVRLATTVAPVSASLRPVFANRGASGIDGILATATGVSLGLDRPVTLLIGDLSLLHDMTSLLLFRKVKQPMVVIVMNNNGGNIFSFLPISEKDVYFDEYFKTPQDVSFQSLSQLIDCSYCCVSNVGDLKRAYLESSEQQGVTLIEVQTGDAQVALDQFFLSAMDVVLV
ncbi:2-succinyl-5-enolpyruvyl-6-hydroxy-3-cyclohexene-1-carboxylic-acid synthase [Candidatus Marinamargulisbacteria bacterium SCGC AG-439-L15]|nr:2-succinyl-5-enolpyruvyl-6-hydroxy-3-cyclohexene-1-carboxylic-acid synthase [Candidatus Marinamargulisbacteria bacterium SCGC AG-439-L15]